MESKYETGATSHAVNDLILYTDNTRVLAEQRDRIYKAYEQDSSLERMFATLLFAAIQMYRKEFPDNHSHITGMSLKEKDEYCRLYAEGYNNWKNENGLNTEEVNQ
jgi:hypothetical protein